MRIGNFRVKRNYKIIQMFLDVVALIVYVAIVTNTFAFIRFVQEQYEIHYKNNQVGKDFNVTLFWLPTLLWSALGLGLILFSLFFIYKNKKLPKRYSIHANTVQQYSDNLITAVCLLRIVLLMLIFELMYTHQALLLRIENTVLGYPVLIYILMCFIVVLFFRIRIKTLSKNENVHEYKIEEQSLVPDTKENTEAVELNEETHVNKKSIRVKVKQKQDTTMILKD